VNERKLLDEALGVLRAAGAQGDAYLEHRRTLNLNVRESVLEDVARAELRGIAVRAMKDGRLGFVHSSAVHLDDARRAAEMAIGLAKAGTPRDDLVIAPPVAPGDGHDEGEPHRLFDATIEERTIDEKVDRCRQTEATAMAHDPRVTRSNGAGYSESLAGFWIGNTRGLFRHYRKSYLTVGVEVVAEGDGEMQPGQRGAEAIRWNDLPDPIDLGRRAASRAADLLGGRPVPTGRYPIIISPDAGWTFLVYLTVALNGEHLSRGRSWLVDRDDPVIGSPLVTVRDDGLHAKGPASIPFDAEGVNTDETVLLEAGRVSGQLLDLATGKRMEAASNGHARRESYEGLPEIGAHNIYLEPGHMSPDDLISDVKEGLWVWGLSGWWIGLDPSNPNYSSAAFGLWIENGEPTKPVARVTIAGGIEEILRGVSAVGSDLEWNYPTKTPTFLVSEMAVSGT